MDKSQSLLSSKNSSSNVYYNNNDKNNRVTKEYDDEIKFLKKVHRWDKMMRNNLFTWDDTLGKESYVNTLNL